MTVGTLLRTISGRELAEWQAEDRIRREEHARRKEPEPGQGVPPQWRPV